MDYHIKYVCFATDFKMSRSMVSRQTAGAGFQRNPVIILFQNILFFYISNIRISIRLKDF